jgi:predicted naringenin-chalcone synthase
LTLFATVDRIAAIGSATPDTLVTQSDAEEILVRHYGAQLSPGNLAILRKIFRHRGIRQRHVAASSAEVLIGETPDARIARFTDQAIGLSGEACRVALARAGVGPDAVRAIVVNTCTGYLCPGLSTYLVQHLALAPITRAYDLVGGGCGGAIPNLEVAAGQLRGCDDDGVVLSVSVEICTATFQMADDVSLIVSNAIFGDGAAAAVLWRRASGLSMVDSASLHAPEHREHIRYVHREGQLHNQLSARLPHLVKPIISRVVETLLERHRLHLGDIRHWAVHPGGERVILAIQDGLQLPDEKLQVTREVLAMHGNMSSPTVWFELEHILSSGVEPGEWIMVIAMGAGLSVHACLLRA